MTGDQVIDLEAHVSLAAAPFWAARSLGPPAEFGFSESHGSKRYAVPGLHNGLDGRAMLARIVATNGITGDVPARLDTIMARLDGAESPRFIPGVFQIRGLGSGEEPEVKLYLKLIPQTGPEDLEVRIAAMQLIQALDAELGDANAAVLLQELRRRSAIAPITLVGIRLSGPGLEIETYHDAGDRPFSGPEVGEILGALSGFNGVGAHAARLATSVEDLGLLVYHLSADLLPAARVATFSADLPRVGNDGVTRLLEACRVLAETEGTTGVCPQFEDEVIVGPGLEPLLVSVKIEADEVGLCRHALAVEGVAPAMKDAV